MALTNFKRWILKSIFRDVIQQGSHMNVVEEIYDMMHDQWCTIFTEDNYPTMSITLDEIHKKSIENTRLKYYNYIPTKHLSSDGETWL